MCVCGAWFMHCTPLKSPEHPVRTRGSSLLGRVGPQLYTPPPPKALLSQPSPSQGPLLGIFLGQRVSQLAVARQVMKWACPLTDGDGAQRAAEHLQSDFMGWGSPKEGPCLPLQEKLFPMVG